MSNLPASGVLGDLDPAHLASDFSGEIEDMRDLVAELPGAVAATTLTISAGAIVPPAGAGGAWHLVDTEGAAASDDLTSATLTNCHVGRRLRLAAANASRVVTIKHSAGNFLNYDSADFVLDALDKWIEYRLVGTDFVEVDRCYGVDREAARDDLGIAPPTIEWLTTGTGATYTTLPEAKAILVEGWGPGGGSGGVDGQSSASAVSVPGAGGGYFQLYIVGPAASYTYTIGAGGVGGASGNNNGSSGTATTFTDGASVSLTANSGAGGNGMLGTAGSSAARGASGGSASGGDINLTGGDSGSRAVISGALGACPTSGAAPMFGGGVRGTVNGAGVGGRVPGEGGGSASSNDATNYAGADGYDGIIKVTTFY